MEDRVKWLLLFLNAEGGGYHTDQIRIMKGLFLFSRVAPDAIAELYKFEPYDYGPFDGHIYRDLHTLKLQGFVDEQQPPGSARRIFRLTLTGQDEARSHKAQAAPEDLRVLESIKKHVTSLSFDDLLKDVYKRHPEFTINSVARVAQAV